MPLVFMWMETPVFLLRQQALPCPPKHPVCSLKLSCLVLLPAETPNHQSGSHRREVKSYLFRRFRIEKEGGLKTLIASLSH